MKNRNIVLCIVLSIVTCGIYSIFWLYQLVVASHEIYGVPYVGDNAILETVLCCTPFIWYWLWLTGTAVDQKNGGSNNYGVIFIILGIFGLGIVDFAILQNEINKNIPAA